jgi:ADP-ribose pyrophosphatase
MLRLYRTSSFIVSSIAKKSGSKNAQVVSSKTVYRGPVFSVTTDYVREPGIAKPLRRDMVRHQGSVVVLAVEERGGEPRVLLARQYRHAVGAPLWELPAGRIDHGESELAGAKRELLEETGITARQWRHAFTFYSSPGFLDETMAIYLARGLTRGAAQPEEDEMIAKRFFPLSQAVRMAMNGAIRDGKTLAAILWYARSVGR